MEQQKQMIQEVINGLDNGSGRFVILDDAHIHDTQSGLKFHMYDAPEPFHITMFESGDEIAHMGDYLEYPELLAMFRTLKEKLINVCDKLSEANRINLLKIYNTPTLPQ